MTRVEAHLLFSTVAQALESPSWPAGIVPNPFKVMPSPYTWDIDYLSLLFSGEVNNPGFTNVEALAVAKGLADWTQRQGRQIRMSAVVINQEGKGLLGFVAVAVSPESPGIA